MHLSSTIPTTCLHPVVIKIMGQKDVFRCPTTFNTDVIQKATCITAWTIQKSTIGSPGWDLKLCCPFLCRNKGTHLFLLVLKGENLWSANFGNWTFSWEKCILCSTLYYFSNDLWGSCSVQYLDQAWDTSMPASNIHILDDCSVGKNFSTTLVLIIVWTNLVILLSYNYIYK